MAYPSPKGTIRGTHHLTFCVGGAQEDYDFHVKTLGLKMVKKTVLFDGEIPIYHLYYGNETGDPSTLLTSFPYRQAGWMGKRGTNQARYLNLSVPSGSIGYWADRLKGAGISYTETERFGAQRLEFEHPSGPEYTLIGDGDDDPRKPYEGGGVPGEHAIRGAQGTTTFVRDIETSQVFICDGMGGEHLGSDGQYHQFQIGTAEGNGRILELKEERDLDQGSWTFGEGTIHHHAFDVIDGENQMIVREHLVGLGFTDASEAKDRGYFFSVYCRSPMGLLVELAWSHEKGFTIDEDAAHLGESIQIPPHWEHRRPEIAQLEPIETITAP
jgi:glyoxalase family protein